jgi:hypothetical protein
MAIAKNRLHIICGLCGSDKGELEYRIVDEPIEDHETGEITGCKKVPYITCNNCASLTALNEEIKEQALEAMNDEQSS